MLLELLNELRNPSKLIKKLLSPNREHWKNIFKPVYILYLYFQSIKHIRLQVLIKTVTDIRIA